jgi:hypothetical protein
MGCAGSSAYIRVTNSRISSKVIARAADVGAVKRGVATCGDCPCHGHTANATAPSKRITAVIGAVKVGQVRVGDV